MEEEWFRMSLRLPVPLRVWLQQRVQRTRRSMNGEIVACLEAAMAGTHGPVAPKGGASDGTTTTSV
jgi:hypothetical protein